MGFGGQKNWGRQEIFLVSGAGLPRCYCSLRSQ